VAVVAAEVAAAVAHAGDDAAGARFHEVAREQQEPGELPCRVPLGRRSAMIFRGPTCSGSRTRSALARSSVHDE